MYYSDSQFFDLNMLAKYRVLFHLEVVEFNYEEAEEHEKFWYLESGYQIIDIYTNVYDLKKESYLSTFIKKGMELLAINSMEYELFKKIMRSTNIRSMINHNLGLSEVKLTNVIEHIWDKYDNNLINHIDLVKHKKFKFKKEANLNLTEIQVLVREFLNEKRLLVMENKKASLVSAVESIIEEVDGFIDYDRMAKITGFKVSLVRKYMKELGLFDKIRRYNQKNFFTFRKDQYKTLKVMREAGLAIHYEDSDLITRKGVSFKSGKPYVTVQRNWDPVKGEFEILNNQLN